MYYKELKKAKPVAEEDVRQLQDSVTAILRKVKEEGDAALRYYSKKFDDYDPESFLVSAQEAGRAKNQLPTEVLETWPKSVTASQLLWYN